MREQIMVQKSGREGKADSQRKQLTKEMLWND